jgi:Ca2+-binding RTX toxin-like protein
MLPWQNPLAQAAYDERWTGVMSSFQYRAGERDFDSSAGRDHATGSTDNVFRARANDVAITGSRDGGWPPGHEGEALVTLAWSNHGRAAHLVQEAPWNTVKTVAVDSFDGRSLTIEGFVDVLARLTSKEPQTLLVEGAKRGSIDAGAGADDVIVHVDDNRMGRGSDFRVDLGGGDDRLLVDLASRDWDGGGPYDGSLTTVWAGGGAGDDVIEARDVRLVATGGSGRDTIIGGGRDDAINGGPGADRLFGGAGADLFIQHRGEVEGDVILDFSGSSGDRIRFEGFGEDGSVVHVGGDQWAVADRSGMTERFWLAHGAALTPADYTFV